MQHREAHLKVLASPQAAELVSKPKQEEKDLPTLPDSTSTGWLSFGHACWVSCSGHPEEESWISHLIFASDVKTDDTIVASKSYANFSVHAKLLQLCPALCNPIDRDLSILNFLTSPREGASEQSSQFSYTWGRRGGERVKLDKCQQSSVKDGIRLCYMRGKELHIYFWVACFAIRSMYLYKEMLGVSFLCKCYFCSKPCWDNLSCSFLTLKFYIIWYRNLIILIC